MDYSFELAVPANTLITAMVAYELSLPEGVIERIRIYFPWGCGNLCHIQIYHNESQRWPSIPGESYAGNDILIDFAESYELVEAWNRLVIRAWNDDDFYAHRPVVAFTVKAVEQIPGQLRQISPFTAIYDWRLKLHAPSRNF